MTSSTRCIWLDRWKYYSTYTLKPGIVLESGVFLMCQCYILSYQMLVTNRFKHPGEMVFNKLTKMILFLWGPNRFCKSLLSPVCSCMCCILCCMRFPQLAYSVKALLIILNYRNKSYTPQDLGVERGAAARLHFTLWMQAFRIYPSTLTYDEASEVTNFTSQSLVFISGSLQRWRKDILI